MTTNDELLVFLRAHEQKMDKYFELTGQQFILINERITEIIETNEQQWQLIHAVIKKKGEKKPVERIAEDVDFEKAIDLQKEMDLAVKASPRTKKPDAPKLPADGKIPEGWKINAKACTKCLHVIAWAPWNKDWDLEKDGPREKPLHCDENGNIIGDGGCWT